MNHLPERAIVGYHQDDEAHWVAELACGHNQHVRHEPPLMSRPWVLTEQGRASRLGTTLRCARCFEAQSIAASLTVRDLAASLAWYRDVVGFAVDREHVRDGVLRAVSLRAGEVRILIGQDDGAKGFDRVKGEGFSLMITTTQNVDELARAIQWRGGTLDSPPADTPWGTRMFRLRDPDGFRFAISSP